MKTILLIEDNKDMRENTAEILELEDYNVITATNAKEGAARAQKQKPDLIICDIMMPVMDGYEVLSALSSDEDTAWIPFIFLTAKADRSDLRKGMEMGADDYLTKPFDAEELIKAINTRFKKAGLMKQEFSRNLEGLSDFMSSAKGIEPLKKLSNLQELRHLKTHETIYKEGGYPKGIYFVVDGRVKTFKTNADSKELITGLYKKGDFFGYLEMIDDKRHSETARAMDETVVCMIPKDEFFSILNLNAEVAHRFIKMLADNVKDKEDQLLKLAYNSSRKKVADAILMLSNQYDNETNTDDAKKMEREDLASLCGLSYENTIRTLHQFKEEGIISGNYGSIKVLEPEKLMKMKN